MTERERLIHSLDEADLFLRNRAQWKTDLNEYDIINLKVIAHVCDEAARTLENAVAPGCKVGDFLYKPKKVGSKLVVVEYVITAIMSIEKDKWIIRYRKDRGQTHHQCSIDEIGKTVFLSREGAAQAKGGGEE